MKVVIAGAAGKMGQAMMNGLLKEADIELVGAVDIRPAGDISEFLGGSPRGVAVEDDLEQTLIRTSPDVLIDFTNPQAVRGDIEIALRRHVDMVIGTTGFSETDLKELDNKARANGVRIVIAPNFALGAVLMMRFAAEAARYFPDAEIIELHHNQKLDAPSGTAIKTLEMMARNREPKQQGNPNEYEKLTGSRGGEYQGMRIHSVRLPGYVAHQEVIFGGPGQTLTIRHDSLNRDSYVPGLLLVLRSLSRVEDGLIYGLDYFF